MAGAGKDIERSGEKVQDAARDVQQKTYSLSRKEGRAQVSAEENWLEVEAQLQHAGSGLPQTTMRSSARTTRTVATIKDYKDSLAMGHADPIEQNIAAASNGNVNSINTKWIWPMKRMNLRNTLSTALLMGGPILATNALAQSQGGYGSDMMGGNGAGWMGGGYGGILVPVLLVVVIAGLVAWIIAQKKK